MMNRHNQGLPHGAIFRWIVLVSFILLPAASSAQLVDTPAVTTLQMEQEVYRDCPAGTVVCGIRSGDRDSRGSVKANQPLCCTLSQGAREGGFQPVGDDYDADNNELGGNVYCNADSFSGGPPRDVMFGGKGGASNQLDFASCQPYANAAWSHVSAVSATQTDTDYYCPNGGVVCGGKNAPEKNDSWSAFYCCWRYIPDTRIYDLTEHDPLPSLSFSRLLCSIANVVVSLGLVVVAAMIGIAGIILLTSRGDEQKRTRGKKALESAVTGFVILLLAKAIILIILGFLGVSLTSLTC